jgi:hypothetical protein
MTTNESRKSLHSNLEAQNTAPPCPEATPPAGSQRAAGRRCQGTDKSGMPCTAWALRDGTHCFFHANPEKVSELGRRGGEAKGARGARYAERSLKTVDDVTALLGDTIKDLGMGLIDPKEATAVGYLAAGMLKALQQGEIESRLRALEAVESSRSEKSRSKVNHDDPPVPTIYSRLNAPKGN